LPPKGEPHRNADMGKRKKVAIIGFPNVGKSTLFNRLLGRKKSLVHNLPGMTRDQIPAECTLEDRTFLLVDTGGLFDSEDPFSDLVRKKAWEASLEADIILFVLDGKRGLLPAEEALYLDLKKLNKDMIIVINKADSPSEDERMGDFFRLGEKNILVVSAEHKRGLDELEELLVTLLPETKTPETAEDILRIAVVGRINVGKSSLINRLCGEEKLIVSEMPGTTRDSTDTLIRKEGKAFSLVDTAGIRKLSRTSDLREKAGIIKAKKDIQSADVVCMVLDAQNFPTRQDTAIAHIAGLSGKPMVLIMNKWDLIAKDHTTVSAYKDLLESKLDFVSYAPVLFVSARTGQRVVRILDAAETVYKNARKKVPTPSLNQFLNWVTSAHPPLSSKRSRIKIKYMTQTGICPPTFLLFTHSGSGLAKAWEKFFLQQIRNKFGFSGTPLRLRLKRN
jgi:GTP-binding protein